MNIMKNNFSMIAAALAVILTTALLIAPAAFAGEHEMSNMHCECTKSCLI